MNVAQVLINGIGSGLVVALPALALALVFGILRFPFFAIGSMLTVGAYAAYIFNIVASMPLWLAAAPAAAATAAVAVLADRGVFRPLRDRSSITLLVASMGLALVLENVVRLFFGNDPRNFSVAVARPWDVLGLRINNEQIGAAATVAVCLLAVHLLLQRTPLGRAMRAVADNPMLAAARGIRREAVIVWTWAIAGTLSAIAGMLAALDGAIEPTMGWNLVVVVFAAAILGGIGAPFGAVAGALLLGVIAELSTLVISAQYRSAVAFVVMAAVLLVRPWGLFGRREIVK